MNSSNKSDSSLNRHQNGKIGRLDLFGVGGGVVEPSFVGDGLGCLYA